MSLSQRAYEQIKHSIISLEYPPRALLDEATLRADLELGRTPIREALQRLAREQLVEIVPRRGIFVSEIDMADLQRLFEMRVPLEVLAVQLAVERGEEAHWDAMASKLAQAEAGISAETLIIIDEACHTIIYEAANNHFLTDTLHTLYALSLRLWYYALRDIRDMWAAVMEHQAMLDAFVARDKVAVANLMETHVRTFQHEIHTAMLERMTVPNGVT